MPQQIFQEIEAKNYHAIDLPSMENRPAKISNRAIIDARFGDEVTLKEDLIEHHDFEALLPAVWNYLTSWYDFVDNMPLLRPVCYDKKSDRHFIDLYLEQNPREALLTDSLLDDSLTVIS